MNGSKTEILAIDPEWLPWLSALAVGKAAVSAKAAAPGAAKDRRGGIAVLSIRGPLIYSASWLEMYGFVSYERIGAAIDELVRDESVSTIVLRVESPGGTALGATELSQKIYDARSAKRIVAHADPYMFSAAYEIATAAHEVYVTPSGMVGSVGAYTMHVDYSEMLKQDGLKVTFIKAGEKKVDGNAYEPLSERALNDIQAEVNHFYDLFVSDVARNRGVSKEHVIENFGKGGRVLATNALQLGMVDGILTLQELLAREAETLQANVRSAVARDFMTKTRIFLELEENA